MIFSSTNKGWNKLHLNSSAQLKAESVCGQGWGNNSLGFSALGLQLNWTAQLTSNPLIPRALRMPGDVTAASKDGSRICGDGAGLSSLPHRELFYSVWLVIR